MGANDQTTRSGIVPVPDEVEVLVATTERSGARQLTGFLRDESVRIRTCSDADAAFEEAALYPPGLVIIDEGLGVALCERLKSNVRTHFLPPVICAQERMGQGARTRAFSAGADAIFDETTPDTERRARVWALLRSHAIFRRTEARGRRIQGEAKDQQRWLGGFVHDLQNAVGSLQANFEFLARAKVQAAGADPELAEATADTKLLFSHLVGGLRVVRDLERLEGGRFELVKTALPTRIWLSDVERDLTVQLDEFDRARVVMGMPSSDHVLEGDREALRQALGLLIGFILKVPPRGSVEVRVSQDGQGPCRIEIVAAAARLAEDLRPRIFTPYAQGKARVPFAHGLGLALARGILQLHGFSVALAGDEHEGLAFLIDLSPSNEPSRSMTSGSRRTVR